MQAAIEVDERAERDLSEIVEYLLAQSERSAYRFASEYEQSIMALRNFPLMGVARGENRWLPIGRTGYVLAYEAVGTLVRVIAVRHGKDPRPLGR